MKALIPVLESLDIDHAISLDDDHALSNTVSDYKLVGVEDFLNACGEEFTAEERDTIDEIGATTVGDLLEGVAIPRELNDKITVVLVNKERPMAALSFLESGFRESSVSYEKATHLDSIQNAPNAGTIWFLDREMGGRDVLPEVIPLISNKYLESSIPCLIVVFTSYDQLDELNCSWQKRFEYLSNELRIPTDLAQVLSYSFFVISKRKVGEKLSVHEGAARQYIGKILIDCMSGYCLYNLLEKMRSYTLKSYDHLYDMTKNANHATIENMCYNMVAEGEPNAYIELKNIQSLMQEKEYTSEFEDCSQYISAMKRLALLPKVSSDGIVSQTIDDIMLRYEWTRFQFIHEDVNLAFSDVAYGDIFSLKYSFHHEDPKPYIGVLVTQPCDCVLREDKGDYKRSAHNFTLLLFELKQLSRQMLLDNKKENWKAMIRKLRNEGIFTGCTKDGDGNWNAFYICASDCIATAQIDPFILDLTSLNVQGTSKLLSAEELNRVLSQNKTQNWMPFSQKLAASISDFCKNLKTLSENAADFTKNLLQDIYGIPFLIENQEFDIRRIGHLEVNLTELISYHYVSHTYRTGKNGLIALHNDRDE